MKAINFHFGETAVTGAWARVAFAEIFGRFLPDAQQQPPVVAAHGNAPERARISLFERLDRWMFRLEQRERDAWLSRAQDIYERPVQTELDLVTRDERAMQPVSSLRVAHLRNGTLLASHR